MGNSILKIIKVFEKPPYSPAPLSHLLSLLPKSSQFNLESTLLEKQNGFLLEKTGAVLDENQRTFLGLEYQGRINKSDAPNWILKIL